MDSRDNPDSPGIMEIRELRNNLLFSLLRPHRNLVLPPNSKR